MVVALQNTNQELFVKVAFLSPRRLGYDSGLHAGNDDCQAFVQGNSEWDALAGAIRLLVSGSAGFDGMIAAVRHEEALTSDNVDEVSAQVPEGMVFDHVFVYIPATNPAAGFSLARRFPQDRLTLVYCDCSGARIVDIARELVPQARHILAPDCGGGITMTDLIDEFLKTGKLAKITDGSVS